VYSEPNIQEGGVTKKQEFFALLLLTVAGTVFYNLSIMKPEIRNRRYTPLRTGNLTPLGDLEAAVMEVVWNAGKDISVSEVHQAMLPKMQVAYTTVKTTLERLDEKGILRRKRDGKAYWYQAALSRETLERRIVSATLDRLLEQFPETIASFFVSPNTSTEDDKLALMEEMIRRKREEQDA
jgi:predicted transcriptional regulator